MESAALTAAATSLTWVGGCDEQDVFPQSLSVQRLSQAQLAAGRQAERIVLVPATEHVAQLAIGPLVVVSGNDLYKK